MKADSEKKLTRNTGFHERTSKLTRNYVDARGFWLPNDYTKHGVINEYTACREKAVVIDLSSLRKFEILGPDAEELMNYTLTRNIKKLSVGQIVYSSMCYENGTMFDDGTLFKLSDHGFRWICGDEYAGEWLKEQAKKKNYKVLIKNSTDQISNISLQGPNSRKILEKFIFTSPTQPSISELQWFRFSICRIEDLNGIPLIISRTGYTGELGYEIWCSPSDAPKVWDKVFEAGKDDGLIPAGFGALDLLRIEAGLRSVPQHIVEAAITSGCTEKTIIVEGKNAFSFPRDNTWGKSNSYDFIVYGNDRRFYWHSRLISRNI